MSYSVNGGNFHENWNWEDLTRRNEEFWALHPAGRALGTGLLCKLFSSTTGFRAGGIYGGISGVINVLTRPIFQGIFIKDDSNPTMRVVGYWLSQSVPWACSAVIMSKTVRHTQNPLFHVTLNSAIGSAVAVSIIGYANEDLLQKKKNDTLTFDLTDFGLGKWDIKKH